VLLDPGEEQRRRDTRHFDERHLISRCVWSLRFLSPNDATEQSKGLGSNLLYFSSFLPDLHLTFRASRLMQIPPRKMGPSFHYLLHFSHIIPLDLPAFKQCIFIFLFFLRGSSEEQTADGHGLPSPASFTTARDIPVDWFRLTFAGVLLSSFSLFLCGTDALRIGGFVF